MSAVRQAVRPPDDFSKQTRRVPANGRHETRPYASLLDGSDGFTKKCAVAGSHGTHNTEHIGGIPTFQRKMFAVCRARRHSWVGAGGPFESCSSLGCPQNRCEETTNTTRNVTLVSTRPYRSPSPWRLLHRTLVQLLFKSSYTFSTINSTSSRHIWNRSFGPSSILSMSIFLIPKQNIIDMSSSLLWPVPTA